MNDTHDILAFIDAFLQDHGEWLPNVTVDFALDLRHMVSESADADSKFEVAA